MSGNGWTAKDYRKLGLGALGASVTDSPVSEQFPVTAGGACEGMVIKIVAGSVTVGAGITAKLQTAIDGEYVDSKTVAITGNGNFYIKLLGNAAGDQTYLPLLSGGRVVVTTGAGSAVTVSKVQVLQPL